MGIRHSKMVFVLGKVEPSGFGRERSQRKSEPSYDEGIARRRRRDESCPYKAKKQIPSDEVGTFGHDARNDKLMR
jgi:hypothetical protein